MLSRFSFKRKVRLQEFPLLRVEVEILFGNTVDELVGDAEDITESGSHSDVRSNKPSLELDFN